MKKSELKDYIKEQIKSKLSEASPEDVANQADLNKELEKTADLMSKMDMKEEEEEDAPAGDKSIEKKASKQDKIIKDYQRLKDLMQTELDMYKSFESPENKDLAKQRLKKLTPEFQAAKKEYEKLKGGKI
jgi:hypothetical protein|tara:strand:- start:423 stop:812 length:390 start_codon:yes stop_codon:yes gene_type:complete